MSEGLYFTKHNIDTARKNAKREPFKSAWALLDSPQQGLDALQTAHLDALRYRMHNGKGGQQAVKILQRLNVPENTSTFDTLRFTAALTQVYVMVADQVDLQDRLFEQVQRLNQIDHQPPIYEAAWLALVNTVAGIALQRDDLFQYGVDFYKQVIDHEIHPQGYIQSVIEVKDGFMLHRFLLTLQALTLIAEAATHAGTNLWAYNNRGVSLITGGLYPLYYYFYPEQWKWDTLPPEEETKAIFKQYAGFLEILNLRIGRPTKAIDLILDDLRPIFDVYGGGLTTLTHAVRRGWFG